MNATTSKLTPSSAARVKRFVEDFIRGRDVETLTAERDTDFINEPERAARCADAAEYGGDGKTHAEVIQDWRDAFKFFIQDRSRKNPYRSDLDRFETAVSDYFDAVETWHDKNGSLYQEIG